MKFRCIKSLWSLLFSCIGKVRYNNSRRWNILHTSPSRQLPLPSLLPHMKRAVAAASYSSPVSRKTHFSSIQAFPWTAHCYMIPAATSSLRCGHLCCRRHSSWWRYIFSGKHSSPLHRHYGHCSIRSYRKRKVISLMYIGESGVPEGQENSFLQNAGHAPA